MLCRSILQLSSRRSISRIPRQAKAQIPAFLAAKREFSPTSLDSARTKLEQPGSSGEPPKSKGGYVKYILGGALVAAALKTIYEHGLFDEYIGKNQQPPLDSSKGGFNDEVSKDSQQTVMETVETPASEEPRALSPNVEHAEQKAESHVPGGDTLSNTEAENVPHVQSQVIHDEPARQKDLAENNTVTFDAKTATSGTPIEESLEKDSPQSNTGAKPNELAQDTPRQTKTVAVVPESKTTVEQLQTADRSENAAGTADEAPSSLLDQYHLRDDRAATSLNRQGNGLEETEAFVKAIEERLDGYLANDGKVVFDFLQAIHAAEERQAAVDARIFAEEKRALKDKYEKELRDSRARELMKIEEVEILDKELKREKTKAVAAISSVQEKMEEKLRMELEQKENEAEMKLKVAEDLAKAKLAAALASEKASQIEKIAEANENINELCRAFYVRSREDYKSQAVNKLALGAIALEDALRKGLPIQKELGMLPNYLGGIDKDSALDLILSSLPEETLQKGTDTPQQLSHKFNALKDTLRHFSLIPPSGGGILTHAVAHVGTWLKLKYVDDSAIESALIRVQSYLDQGKLSEAADALEEGVRGSEAEDIVTEWVKGARNRAITEQALIILESYAICISLT